MNFPVINENKIRTAADTLEWLSIVMMICSTVPSLLALLSGLSDQLPSFDIVIFIWTSLVLLFGRAMILRNMLNIATISVGFILQSTLMALVLFK